MRRLAPLAILLPLLVVSAGCSTSKPGGRVTTPTPAEVIGTVPKAQTGTVPPLPERRPDGRQDRLHRASAVAAAATRSKTRARRARSARTSTRPSRALSLAVLRVTHGQGAMPTFKGTLTDKQIADVVAYVVKASGGNPNG